LETPENRENSQPGASKPLQSLQSPIALLTPPRNRHEAADSPRSRLFPSRLQQISRCGNERVTPLLSQHAHEWWRESARPHFSARDEEFPQSAETPPPRAEGLFAALMIGAKRRDVSRPRRCLGLGASLRGKLLVSYLFPAAYKAHTRLTQDGASAPCQTRLSSGLEQSLTPSQKFVAQTFRAYRERVANAFK